jgi:hypothetical protein
VVKAEPQRRGRRELRVAAADDAAENKPKAATRTTQPAERCDTISAALIPTIAANAKKPPKRISDTRLEMVMVKRSLEAANAISAGNSIKRIASATMIMLSSCASAPAPLVPVKAGSQGYGLRFQLAREWAQMLSTA